jgi:hypothetical protein
MACEILLNKTNNKCLSEVKIMSFENLKVGERIQLDVGDVVQGLTREQIKPKIGPWKGWTIEVARIFIDGGGVRFRDDTGGEPTTTDGDILNDGDFLHLIGEQVQNFKVISTNGTVKVNITPFYKFGN